jgi:hypothetical protein
MFVSPIHSLPMHARMTHDDFALLCFQESPVAICVCAAAAVMASTPSPPPPDDQVVVIDMDDDSDYDAMPHLIRIRQQLYSDSLLELFNTNNDTAALIEAMVTYGGLIADYMYHYNNVNVSDRDTGHPAHVLQRLFDHRGFLSRLVTLLSHDGVSSSSSSSSTTTGIAVPVPVSSMVQQHAIQVILQIARTPQCSKAIVDCGAITAIIRLLSQPSSSSSQLQYPAVDALYQLYSPDGHGDISECIRDCGAYVALMQLCLPSSTSPALEIAVSSSSSSSSLVTPTVGLITPVSPLVPTPTTETVATLIYHKASCLASLLCRNTDSSHINALIGSEHIIVPIFTALLDDVYLNHNMVNSGTWSQDEVIADACTMVSQICTNMGKTKAIHEYPPATVRQILVNEVTELQHYPLPLIHLIVNDYYVTHWLICSYHHPLSP